MDIMPPKWPELGFLTGTMKKAQEKSVNADRARMQGVLNRVQDALRLGLCGRQNASLRWCNNDVGVQSQALRVISELLTSYASSVSSLPVFKEILVALEGLLQVQNQQIRCRAADLCNIIVAECSGNSVENFVSPLARLISSKGSTSASAAIALKNIVEKARTWAWEQYMRTISDAGTVQQLVNVLEAGVHDSSLLAAYTELLALLLERLPKERYVVGFRPEIRRKLLECGGGSNDDVLAQAAVRALSSLAICSDLVPLVISDEKLILVMLEQCLSPLRSTRLKTEALNLVYCLGAFSRFLLKCKEADVQALALKCLKLLEASWSSDEKWSLETEGLALAAALAIRVVLSTPGRHRMQLFSAGIINVLRFPLTRDKPFKKTWLMWELAGWVGCFCDRTEEAVLFGPDSSFGGLIDSLCAAFFGAVCRKGRKPDLSRDGQYDAAFTTEELVAICRTAALLVSSPSPRCVSRAHQAATKHWRLLDVSLVVDSLYAGYGGGGGPDRVVPHKSETLARVYALSTLLSLAGARHELEVEQQDRVVEVLINLIRERYCQIQQTREIAKPLLMLMRPVVPCCLEGTESWSGKDELLFASVWALAVQLRNFEARFHQGGLIDTLRELAGDKSCPDGVRWHASAGLACCGYYGFPSLIGKQLSKLRAEPTLADVRLVVSDKKVFQAHGAVLAARCRLILSDRSKQDREAKDVVIRLSARVGEVALEKILDYVYTGVVQLEPREVPEVRALAKKLEIHSLLKLLLNSARWGEPAENTSLESALVSDIGHQFFDAALESAQGSGAGLCEVCGRSSVHIHAHKAVLSARCDYFEALFRSGMRESFQGTVQVPFKIQVVLKFVRYLYTGELESSGLGCAWNTLDASEQLDSIEQMIDLASLAQQWLQEDLHRDCVKLVHQMLERMKVSLCSSIMKYAYSINQVEVVLATARRMAAEYPQLRDSGALDCLDDVLCDLLRTSYVKLAVN